MTSHSDSRRLAPALWALFGLFCLRVLGQALVAFAHVAWLPPMPRWYSGLISYPYLLASQVVIIAVLSKASIDFTVGRGWFARPHPSFGRSALVFGYIYLGSMIVRYALTRTLLIPVAFHCVLATYVILVGRYHARPHAGRPLGPRARVAAAIVLLATAGSGCRALVSHKVLPREGRPRAFAIETRRDLALLMADGTRLLADVYRPRTEARTPTVLVRVPFSDTRLNRAAADVVGRYWAARGYAVVIQGTRGRYRSGGRYYPLRHEREDGIETLRWLAAQPWYDGRLGMWGGSTFGYTQWVLADQTAPGPRALMIQISSTDFHGMFYPGGAFSLESALFWAIRSRGTRDVMPTSEEMRRGVDGFPLIEADDRAAGDIPFFNDWAGHAEKDDYWKAIDGEDRAVGLKAPALLMGGWYDPFLPTQIEDYLTIRRRADPEVARRSRLIIGPWAHAFSVKLADGTVPRNYRQEALAPSLDWFDRHVAGMATPDADTPPVRIFVMGANRWRDEEDWPLARAEARPYFLHAGRSGALRVDPPREAHPPSRFIYDPRDPVPSAGGAMLGPRAGVKLQNDIERRPDVLVFTTPALDRDTEVTGPVSAILYVATTAPSTDFTVKLVDVHPDGRAFNVTDGIARRRYSPGRPTEIAIQLWPTSMVFKRGHRIRVEVSSSNFPRFDRNPNTGGRIATETRPVSAEQIVFHDAGRPSRVILPIVAPER